MIVGIYKKSLIPIYSNLATVLPRLSVPRLSEPRLSERHFRPKKNYSPKKPWHLNKELHCKCFFTEYNRLLLI